MYEDSKAHAERKPMLIETRLWNNNIISCNYAENIPTAKTSSTFREIFMKLVSILDIKTINKAYFALYVNHNAIHKTAPVFNITTSQTWFYSTRYVRAYFCQHSICVLQNSITLGFIESLKGYTFMHVIYYLNYVD